MNKSDFTQQLSVSGQSLTYYDIQALATAGMGAVDRLPFSIRILVENLLRKHDGKIVGDADIVNIAGWQQHYDAPVEIPYHPARVLMQDFTGVPAVVDLASMREAVKTMGGDPSRINPLVPVDLVVDHSVQVDYFGTAQCQRQNVAKEYERNGERYALLKWAQESFDNFKVVPPRSGICHQVNLEYLGQTVITREEQGRLMAFPDTLVGLDSHTTMINAIGVMGWGVGGIEAEAVMLGQPYYMAIPEVIGVRLEGALQPGVTATDMVLHITRMLREYRVVEKFVEFFGPGMKKLGVPDRATIANMAPEYGATMGFFPVDEKTIDYLKLTNRHDRAAVVEAYTRAAGFFYGGDEKIDYTDVLELDLSRVEPALAGPARPQDHIALGAIKEQFAKIIGCEYKSTVETRLFSTFLDESGAETERVQRCVPVSQRFFDIDLNGRPVRIGDGTIVVAAITSCTNTSNPWVLIGAGLLAQKALKRGLRVPPYVKTSLAPGSKVVTDYLDAAGVTNALEALGFHTAAFGCTTCIGNSGPLAPAIEEAIVENNLNVAAVLSGNRNFEARIHQRIRSNFLASPMLVVAFALAGRIDVDFFSEPVGVDPNGQPVYLNELWPKDDEIAALAQAHVKPQFFATQYSRIFEGDEYWHALDVTKSATFAWNPDSTYIKNPPYFDNFKREVTVPTDITAARVLLLLGDSVTTDHISPAGAIAADYPAGRYLIGKDLDKNAFNSYGSRRGNHEVMMRGTFGNIRIKNLLAGDKEGSYTIKFPQNEPMFVYEAAMAYGADATPLVVLGGSEYGTGSSRDWAAKGTFLLGVRAVIAASFERIHRSNLVGMGVLPLVFKEGQDAHSLCLDGSEIFTIGGIEGITPRAILTVSAQRSDGDRIDFEVLVRLDTDIEVAYFQHGGILPYVLRKLMKEA
jgi:aconitate hydratase